MDLGTPEEHPGPAAFRRRRHPVRYLSLVVLGAAVLGLGWWVVAAAVRGTVDAVGVAGLFVAAVGLALDLAAVFRQPDRSGAALAELADDLARTVDEQWYEEARARRLRDPGVLPLAWTETQRQVRDSPAAVLGDDSLRQDGLAVRLRLSGRLRGPFDTVIGQLAAGYRRVPSGRLVLLGEPGAGKTVLAVLLTLGLLRDRAPGAAVPVLLSASTWDPLSEGMDEWLVRSLATSYYNGRAHIAQRLLDHDLLLPVIDGLDEIHESGRRAAVREINRAVGASRPVVLTCRSVEYEDLIRGGAPVLRRAPVVEVCPVPERDAVAYLDAVSWPDGTSWGPVYAHLRARGESPVAEAFSTPLMVSTARIVYERLGGDPAELLDPVRFDSRHAVEDYLTDRLIDAAYAPGGGGPPDRAAARWSDPARARHWLTFLARYLHQHRERDLVWWRMSQRLISPWIAPAIGIGGGVLFMVVVAAWAAAADDESRRLDLHTTLLFAAWVGAAFAVLATVVWYATGAREPGRLSFALRGSLARLRRGFVTGLGVAAIPAVPVLAGLGVSIEISDGWTLLNIDSFLQGVAGTAAAMVVIGCALAAHHWLDAPPVRAAQATPQGSLRQDRVSSWAGATVAGVTVGILLMPAVLAGVTLGSLASKWLSSWAGWPGYPDPHLIAVARGWDLTWKLFGSARPLLVGAAFLLPGLVFALLVLLTRAWPRFLLLQAVLAARGDLPWSLMGFLADARRRELLRQSAGAYQFRHIRLQERLANRPLAEAHAEDLPAARRRAAWRTAAGLAAVAAVLASALPLAAVPDDGARATLTAQYDRGPYTVRVSPDGGLVAAYTREDPRIRVWEVATGRRRLLLAGEAEVRGVYDVTFSPDGRFVAARIWVVDAAGGRTVARIWETAAGRTVYDHGVEVTFLAGGRGAAVHVEADPEGKNPPVRLIDLTTGGPLGDLRGTARLRDLRFGEAQQYVVRGGTGPYVLYRSRDGRRIATLADTEGDLRDLAFTEDGRRVVTREGRRARLWDAESGRLLATLSDLDDADHLEVSPDGARLASTGGGARITTDDDHVVRLWDDTGRLLATHPGLPGVEDLTFSPDGRRLAALVRPDPEDPAQTRMQLWDASSGQVVASVPNIQSVQFLAADGHPLLVERRPDVALLLDGDTGRVRAALGGLAIRASEDVPGPGVVVARPRSATLLARVRGGGTHVWDVASGTVALTLADTVPRTSLQWSPNGRILVAPPPGQSGAEQARDRSDAGDLQLWEMPSGRALGTIPRAVSRPTARPSPPTATSSLPGAEIFAFSPDSEVILTVIRGDERVRLWEAGTGRLLATLVGHTGAIQSATFTPDGRTVVTAGAQDDTVRLWDVPR
ncbi:MAG TPA: hypothetical protein VNV66_01985 [Pilimelia sp.]|nr:hypothetical protein [Pilimelia sp.]